MDGQTHSCPNDDFPVLRHSAQLNSRTSWVSVQLVGSSFLVMPKSGYREDKDEKTGEAKTVCDCVKKMVPPKDEL